MPRFLFFILLFVSFLGFNQTVINYQNNLTPQGIVDNVLLGFGVTATNVTFNGGSGSIMAPNLQSFTANNFPFSSGLYLTTDNGSIINDPDLNVISTNTIENGGVLEFDFVATGANLSFNYMFASSEYPDYVCSNFNDVFGFFISGPGITGPYSNNGRNIALVPNTNIPVSINTVNSGTPGFLQLPFTCALQDPNWQSNSIYYTTMYSDYGGEGYNGGTVSLPANVTLQCGETYHIKIAIANVGDESYDSGVYIEANSFSTNAVNVSFVSPLTGNNIVDMYEGCQDIDVIFARPSNQSTDSLIVSYHVGGTATMGVDYNNLPNPIVFLPGQDTLTFSITAYADNISDNNESVIITVLTITECGDSIITTGTINIFDSVSFNVSYTNPVVPCIRDSVQVILFTTGGFAPYTHTWSNGEVGNIAYLSTLDVPQGVKPYFVTTTDACGYSTVDTVLVTVNQTLKIDTLISSPANCNPVGTAYALTFPYGAHLQNPSIPNVYDITFEWTYLSDTNRVFPNQSALDSLSSGWYTLTITDNVINCSVTDSVYVDVENVPVAQLEANPSSGCTSVTPKFTNTSQNANQYFWDFGNGQTLVTSDLSAPSYTYTSNAIIQLVASNGDPTCNDTTTINIGLVHCGCTDPTALNYDMNAVLDDGSCKYPTPTVEAPNVITLNGDGVNDIYLLKTEFAKNIELTIVNRWGNIIYSGVGTQASPPMWDGKDTAGNEISEGVYFYTYKIVGETDAVLEGHGFVTVVK